MTSILYRNAGTQKEWMTSREVSSNSTRSPTGRYSVGSSCSTPGLPVSCALDARLVDVQGLTVLLR